MAATDVELVEVGPRDGLQNETAVVPTDAKVAYIERLVEAGLRRIEAASFVNPLRVPQMADAEAVMARIPRRAGVRYIGLVLNERGLDRALEAGADEVNVVVLATDTFSERNQGVTVDESIAAFGRIAARANAAGVRVTVTVGAAFGCPFEGEVSAERVAGVVARCAASGPDEVALADTIGVGVPRDVHRLVDAVRRVSDAPLRFHFHNTRNSGYANALTAAELGAAALDASSGGIGGCPFAPSATGNVATEDVSYLLRRSGIESGVHIERVLDASRYIEGQLGRPNAALLGRAGDFPSAASA